MQDREEKTEQQLQETIQAADEQPILISDACKQLNMEAHVLRYWEEELGLPIMRNDQGYRCYTNAQLLMFQRIKILRDAGYQLKAIKLVVPRLALFPSSLSSEKSANLFSGICLSRESSKKGDDPGFSARPSRYVTPSQYLPMTKARETAMNVAPQPLHAPVIFMIFFILCDSTIPFLNKQ